MTNKNYIEQESGRSMVEMLGVLAIIGVLSVGGISGYTTAMNKHKANEILNAAAVRAMAVSTQLQSGVTDPTLAEFPTGEEVGGAKFGDVSKVGDSQFKIGFTTQPAPVVVEQMKNIAGDNVGVDGSRLLYNNDLSSGVDNTATNPANRDANGDCLADFDGTDCDQCTDNTKVYVSGECTTCTGGSSTTKTSVPAGIAGCYCAEGTTWNSTEQKCESMGSLFRKGSEWAGHADLSILEEGGCPVADGYRWAKTSDMDESYYTFATDPELCDNCFDEMQYWFKDCVGQCLDTDETLAYLFDADRVMPFEHNNSVAYFYPALCIKK